MPLVALAPPGGSNDLDRYELLFRFAAGGMAEVFVARQRGEGGFLRPVAIKRMLPALAEEPKFVEMFLDEARLAALVQSPYVVPTLDCGKDEEGSPYIVMELVVGVSLSQALRGAVEHRRHVPPPIMAEVIAQTALGLYDAHHACTPTGQPLEIVHRDVSPQNILIGVDGRARLTDFGVARALERVSRTSTGEVKGKLSYFSPEQARMERLDQRSDIFALGVVAWEVLALERLFSRDNPMAALQAVLNERIPDVRELNPDVPEPLALVVARALERDRTLRYPTARDFAEDLRRAAGSATAAAIGAWVEEGGGPRLATFRSKIEHAFARQAAKDARTEVDVALPAERDRSGSVRSGGTVTPTPSALHVASESHVIGPLGTLPNQPVSEGSRTEARPSAVPVDAPHTRVGADRPRLIVVDDAPEPRRPPWIAAVAALVGLALLGGGSVYYFSGTVGPATPPVPVQAVPGSIALPRPPAADPTPPPAVVAPAASAPELAPPSASELPRGHRRGHVTSSRPEVAESPAPAPVPVPVRPASEPAPAPAVVAPEPAGATRVEPTELTSEARREPAPADRPDREPERPVRAPVAPADPPPVVTAPEEPHSGIIDRRAAASRLRGSAPTQ